MLQLINARKTYRTAGLEQVALDGVSITFRDNEFVAILGPSGSGKTTLLNLVGGLDQYDSGDLVIDHVSTRRYKDRDWDTYRNNRIGFVFQSYNLIPHQSVLTNVELALTLAGVDRPERRRRAVQALTEVGLADHMLKRPTQLSGGQMQRVAIARALINDPEILLADEPTGALDSKTGQQVMGLLSQIARDRLVIMVTHNPDLARAYATRIVNLHDGQVQADSDPYQTEAPPAGQTAKAVRKTSMSFFTAIALSLNNLLTKKGRTLMTAFAGSIGIVGIAAILALANGVNTYIRQVEEDTLTIYPLSIQSTGVDITSLMMANQAGGQPGSEDATEPTGQVRESRLLSRLFSRIGSNDLAALKTYLDQPDSGVAELVNSIQYTYSVSPQIYASDTSQAVRQVNPNNSFSALGFGSGSSTSSLLSMGFSTDVFHQLMDDTDLLADQYDVVAGDWPTAADECLLVLGSGGWVSDLLLYAMGLRDPAELDRMVNQMANNETVVVPQDRRTYSYEQLLDVTFKLVRPWDYYVWDPTYQIWTDLSRDQTHLKPLVESGTTLRVTGLASPKSDAQATSLSPGLYYTADLVRQLMAESAQTEIVRQQLADPGLNIFSGQRFVDEAAQSAPASLDLAGLIQVDQAALTQAFQFDTASVTAGLDFSRAIDPDAIMGQLPAVPAPDLSAMATSLDLELSEAEVEQLNQLVSQVMSDYATYSLLNGVTDPQAMIDGFPAWLESPEVSAQLMTELGQVTALQTVERQVSRALQGYVEAVMRSYMEAVLQAVQSQVANSMNRAMFQLQSNLSQAMRIDPAQFTDAFSLSMSQEELSGLMMSLLRNEDNSYDSNLSKLGYADLAKPSSIDIYPKDFEDKQAVLDILDAYNERMTQSGLTERVITYTDIVGALMSSVTDIVNMISYVLVAFVSISLVVSSIMIGVITYISVLERKKEIGILRALGARKRDIARVFNAETLIIGFVAGAMGIAATLLLTLPANAFVSGRFDIDRIAILPALPAAGLVAVSMGLTFLAGLIPSSAASRRDPVEALRSE
ncbi:MAG: ABC transporter ATP-binding protein/permease [Propionibacteriaceae bacterium]|jgi:ABC-type lipoprotein export system ATPase subunit|nr:ABC transporter ATP-binding protein/permease [Propionibacteriaceae bacterium]